MKAIPHPPVASCSAWLEARRKLLAEEKALTRQRDRVNALRRRLPMVPLEKHYTFEGAAGPVQLRDLFEGRPQLIVYHFMFDPTWDKGCRGCTGYVNALGDLSMLYDRDTSFVLISRAPFAKLHTYQQEQGWTIPWYSSYGTDFNYDFHVTLDDSVAPVQFNYRDQTNADNDHGKTWYMKGENHGLSVFFRIDEDLFHTYSMFARGCEGVTDAYSLLDVTPYGRQEDFEDSPPGWPQRPTYG